MAYVDYAAINTLQQVVSEYKDVDIAVVFAACKGIASHIIAVYIATTGHVLII